MEDVNYDTETRTRIRLANDAFQIFKERVRAEMINRMFKIITYARNQKKHQKFLSHDEEVGLGEFDTHGIYRGQK